MKVNAYAKINLTLDITGQREDGYHTIESVMQSITLCDEVEIKRNDTKRIQLSSNRKLLPLDMKNTAYRAASEFFAHTGIKDGVDIWLQKIIPGRAGLGGGSADGAAVIRAMDAIYQTRLTDEDLLSIATRVGADVAFCVMGGTCVCFGIGEILEPVPSMPDCTIVICKPAIGMSTPRAYSLVDQYPIPLTKATPKMISALESGNIKTVAGALSNRFDDVLRLSPVKKIKRLFKDCGALNAVMTGSGSAVYGIFSDPQKAQTCAEASCSMGSVFLAKPKFNLFEDIES